MVAKIKAELLKLLTLSRIIKVLDWVVSFLKSKPSA